MDQVPLETCLGVSKGDLEGRRRIRRCIQTITNIEGESSKKGVKSG
jgi:hypothetical protein